MGHWNGDEWRWRLKAPSSIPSMTICDLSDEQRRDREEKLRGGALVVPFGFSRILGPIRSGEPVDPLRWEGDDA